MDVTLYPEPNPALTAALVGPGMRRAVEHSANIAMLLYQAKVAKRTTSLARSARVSTEIGGVDSDRWIGAMTIGGRGVDYGAAHDLGMGDKPESIVQLDGRQRIESGAHDLNAVLAMLGSY